MQKVKLLYQGQDITLWDFAGQFTSGEDSYVYGNNALFEDKVKKTKLMTLCETLTDVEVFVYQMFEDTDLKTRIKRWFNLKIFGTFEQLRTEMEIRYPKTETIFLRTNDHKRIHAYWIPSQGIMNQMAEQETTFEDTIDYSGQPTMILCNPNAEYAEQIQYNTDLLDFYIENGINVVVYNYRGYGLSQGTPSINKIKEDSETVAMYVRQRVGPDGKIGAHGRSIGGVVATHLGRKGLVDFLFADRTFQSLDRVAKYTMGTWAEYALPFFTMWWNTDVTTDYIFTSCYKVMASDSNDEIINDNASLKTGVAQSIINNELKVRLMEQAFKLRNTALEDGEEGQAVLVLPQSRRKLGKFTSQARAITNYHHILNSQEMNILFRNLNEIFGKIHELELHKRRIRRKLKQNLNTSKMAETNRQLNMTVMSNNDYPLISPSGIGTTFGFESARGNHDSAELLLDSQQKGPVFNNTNFLETQYIPTERDIEGEHSLLSSVEVSPRDANTLRRLTSGDNLNHPDINNATSRTSKAHYIKHRKTRELERKYRKQLGDQKTDFVDYLEFLVQFFKTTERLDAAGCTLQKVFGLVSEEGDEGENHDQEGDEFLQFSESEKSTMFKHWILNLDVYGSFEPLNPQCYDIMMARSAAFTKLVSMRRRLRKMIDFWEELTEDAGMLMHKLLQQVELIDFYLNKVEFYFSKKQDEEGLIDKEEKLSNNSVDESNEGQAMTTISEEDDLEIANHLSPGMKHTSAAKAKKRAAVIYDMKKEEERHRVATEGQKANGFKLKDGTPKRAMSHFDLCDEYIKFRDFAEPNVIKTGHLIPLKCGHNGTLSINERTIYEIHLINAGFIQSQAE